jgi:polyhydroxyalkanoate synthesis regulator phasin
LEETIVRTKLITLTAAGLLAAGGVAVAVPALADTDSADPAATGSSRVDRITEALAGLVSDGSLTQEQVDEVAATLDAADLRGGHGGWHGGGPGGGRGLGTAASALGMTEEELRTALEADGATLASVAEEQGVAVDPLVDALVAAAQERVTQAVTDGDLTQEQADERLADLEAWITERVKSTWGDEWQRPTDSGD